MRITRPSDLHFKVINAVINTLRNLDSVAYVSGGNGGSGFGLFSPSDDFHVIRKQLWDFDLCEDIDASDEDFDILFNEWAEYDEFDSAFHFYELSNREGLRLQVMLNPEMYANSHQLRDMIVENYDGLSSVEITEGMNGYPCALRGAVVGVKSWDQAAQISDLYGVDLVKLQTRDGWQFYTSCGHIYEDFDMFDVYADDPNFSVYTETSEFVEVIEMMMSETDEEDFDGDFSSFMADLQSLRDAICEIDLTDKVLLVPSSNWRGYEVIDRYVPHYHYDVWTNDIALDCRVIL